MSGEPTLQKGDSGEWVGHLQELMRDAGFWQDYASGTFDDDLEQAVQALQGDLGLSQTGVVEDDTWSALQQRTGSAQQPAQADGSVDDDQAVTSQDQDNQQTDTPSSTSADSGDHPTLRKGTSSEWVRYLQQVMQHVGYWTGDADGTFGDDLEQAVQTLQGGNGVPQSGVVDAETWNVLDWLQRQATSAQDTQTESSTTTDTGDGPTSDQGSTSAGYDSDAWDAFLAQNGPRWNGDDAVWDQFRTWFAYEAGQQGLADPADGFLAYVEGQQDKVAAFAAYGVTITQSVNTGDGTGPEPSQTPDVSQFPKTELGDSGDWVAYLDAMLTSNGF